MAGRPSIFPFGPKVAGAIDITGKLDKVQNLSDVANAATAKTNLGLGNVDNTSDLNKPVSTAQTAAFAAKNLNNATIKPNGTDAVSRAVYIKAREFLSVGDFKDGLTDDATALNRALTSAFEGGDALPVHFFDSLTIDAPITMPDRTILKGPAPAADQSIADANGMALTQGVLRVSSSVSIFGGFSSKIQDCRIVRLGITQPTTTAEAIASISAMAGTAIRTTGIVGFEAENLLIIGFNRAIDFQNNGRGKLRNIKIDCTNGVRWQGSLDVSRIENVHAWPWLTVGFAASDARVLWRAGVGIAIGAPANFTGSVSGTTLTVTSVGVGNVIFAGQTLFDQGTLIGTIVALGTGTGGTGTYILDTSTTLSSRVLRSRIQNDWTNIESCFTFGYQIGYTFDEAKHPTILNCASDNAAQLLFGPYDAEAQTKIGLNIQGETWNAHVIGFRGAGQGKGALIQPTAAGADGVTWAPMATLDSPRFWGSGTYALHHAAGEMVLNNPSPENIWGGAGNAIRIDDAVLKSVINFNGPSVRIPTISYQSSIARDKTVINNAGIRIVASATSITTLLTDKRVKLTGTSNVQTMVATHQGHRISLFADGASGSLNIVSGGNIYLQRGVAMPLTSSSDVIEFECDGVSWYEVSRSINSVTNLTDTALADPFPVNIRTTTIRVTSAGSFGTIDDPNAYVGKKLSFVLAAAVTFVHGGSMVLRERFNFKGKAGDSIEFIWNGSNYVEVSRSSNQTALNTLSLPVTSQTGAFNVAVNATTEIYDDGGEFLDVFVGFLIPTGATGAPGNPGGFMYITLPNNSARGVFAHGYDPQTNLAHLVASMVPGSGILSIYKTGNASAIVDLANIQLRLRYRRALL